MASTGRSLKTGKHKKERNLRQDLLGFFSALHLIVRQANTTRTSNVGHDLPAWLLAFRLYSRLFRRASTKHEQRKIQ